MKNLKRIASFVLALVMVFSLAITASAAGEGSITITNATENVKYSIYKVFDLTYAGNAISYTYTKTGDNDALYTALSGTGSPFTLTESSTTGVYNVTTTETDGAKIGAWLKDNVSSLTETESLVATGTTVTFDNIDYGYYYVTSTLGTAIAVNSAKPNANITDKNEKPTVEKKVKEGENWADENDANIGDTVYFKADITVQTGAKNYVLHDTMEAGLTFNANSVAVKVGETVVGATNYTVTSTDLTDGCTFEVSFDNTYLAGLNDGTVITVEYSATLNEDAVIDGEGNDNTVKLSYGDTVSVDHDNNPDTPDQPKTPETVPDTTTTYTYAIALKKVDQDGDALAGATFQFPFYVNATADDDGAYIYAGTTAAEGLTNTITTPQSGEIVVKGVKAGIYYITETAAPGGYNKLTAPVSVTAVKTSETTTNTTTYLDEDGNVVNTETETVVTYNNENLAATVIVVVNKTGTELPSTGGMGTTLFYVFGGVLVLAAVVLLVTKKRMSVVE